MAFGLSFAAKKTKSSGTTTVDKLETGTQTGSENTTGTRTGTQSTTGATTNTGLGTSSTLGTSTQQQAATGSQTQTGTTRSLSENVLGGLEGAVSGLLAQILDPNTGDRAMMNRGISAMGDFDVDSYVNGTLMQARATQGTALDELLGSVFSRVGGVEGNNSASTLLANRARNDSAANLAGVEAQARATGADLVRKNLESMTGAVGQMGAQLLPQIAAILKGGETSTDVSTLTEELSRMLGETTGTTGTSESSTQAQTGTTTTTESLIQAVLNALQQSTHTTGTETTKTKGSEMGGGMSFGI